MLRRSQDDRAENICCEPGGQPVASNREESKIVQAIDHNTITDVVIEQMSGTPNPRLRQIMESLVRHLHEFAREVDLIPQEWLRASGS